jgi:hypothetical protein
MIRFSQLFSDARVTAVRAVTDSSTAEPRRVGGSDLIALASLSLMAPTDGSDRLRPPRSPARSDPGRSRRPLGGEQP